MLNTLQTSNFDEIFDFCVDSASLATKVQRHYGLINVTCCEIGNVYQVMLNDSVNIRGE